MTTTTYPMRKIEAGVYETEDGQHRVERIDSLGEVWSAKHGQYVDSTSSVWVVTAKPSRPNGEWVEVSQDYMTKREAVAALGGVR